MLTIRIDREDDRAFDRVIQTLARRGIRPLVTKEDEDTEYTWYSVSEIPEASYDRVVNAFDRIDSANVTSL